MAFMDNLRYSMVAFEAIHKGYTDLISQVAQFVADAQAQTDADLAGARYGSRQDGLWAKSLFEDQAREHMGAVKRAGGAVEGWWSHVVASHDEVGQLDSQSAADFKATADKIHATREAQRGAD